MKLSITSSKEVIDGLVKTLQSPGYNMQTRVKLLNHFHDKGFSVANIDLVGELSDLFFMGLYTTSTIHMEAGYIHKRKGE